MLHSKYYHKEEKPEDQKTSAIFENLLLLPDNVFWHVLRQSCFSDGKLPKYSGRVLNYDFWPHWNSKGTDNIKYVEPDLFIRFEEFDVIIEAKYGSLGGQYLQQWQREITAYHNEYGNDKQFVFIAIGGNELVIPENIKVKKEDVQVFKCNWLSLLISIDKYRKVLDMISVPDINISATKRLLDNIKLAFNLHRVYSIDWFDSMSRSKPVINNASIEKIQKLFSW